MKPFTESERYSYPLTPDSLVVDIGAHKGTFSKQIAETYGCRILAFEPVAEFFTIAQTALAHLPNVKVFHSGIGANSRWEEFIIKGDMTGKYADQGPHERVAIMSVSQLHRMLNRAVCDLIKINIEGMEFELLEEMLNLGIQKSFLNIQVQFHGNFVDAVARHAKIRERLLQTHYLTYDAPFCWENYKLK